MLVILSLNTPQFLNRQLRWNRLSSQSDLNPGAEQRIRHYQRGTEEMSCCICMILMKNGSAALYLLNKV
jgi:hypothetical protein